MKKTIYYLAFSAFVSFMSLSVSAQQKVKDGTVSGSSSLPHAGAIQELESTNKGQLLPRVSLSNTTVWGLAGTQVAGMEVYNTNSGIIGGSAQYPANGAALYYWDGSGWVSTKATKDLAQADSYTNPIVIASKVSSGEIQTNNTPFDLTGYSETRDVTNSFDPVTGIFTAPIKATYIFNVTAVAIFVTNWTTPITVLFTITKPTDGDPNTFIAVVNPIVNPALSGGPHEYGAVFLFNQIAAGSNFAIGGSGRLPYNMTFAIPLQLDAGEKRRFKATSFGNNSNLSHLGIASYRVEIANY